MFFRTNAVVFLAAMGAVGAIPTAFAHNSALEQHVNHGTDHAADTEVAIDVNTASSSFTQEPGDMEELTRIFSDADIVDGPSIVPCTLSGGTETNCFSITVKQTPSSYTPGPWCPGHINDTADTGGIWLEAGEVNDVDGKFIENLASFYDDEKFSLFDEATGISYLHHTVVSAEFRRTDLRNANGRLWLGFQRRSPGRLRTGGCHFRKLYDSAVR